MFEEARASIHRTSMLGNAFETWIDFEWPRITIDEAVDDTDDFKQIPRDKGVVLVGLEYALDP